MAYKHTSHFVYIGNIWCTRSIDNITNSFLNGFELLRNMINTCDMFRITICEYTLIWYRNGKKGRLTICESKVK